MPIKTVPLTDIKIKSAKYAPGISKLFDGGGLFLLIKPTGSKLQRLKYRLGDAEKLLAIGTYPLTTLPAKDEQMPVHSWIRVSILPGAAQSHPIHYCPRPPRLPETS